MRREKQKKGMGPSELISTVLAAFIMAILALTVGPHGIVILITVIVYAVLRVFTQWVYFTNGGRRGKE